MATTRKLNKGARRDSLLLECRWGGINRLLFAVWHQILMLIPWTNHTHYKASYHNLPIGNFCENCSMLCGECGRVHQGWSPYHPFNIDIYWTLVPPGELRYLQKFVQTTHSYSDGSRIAINAIFINNFTGTRKNNSLHQLNSHRDCCMKKSFKQTQHLQRKVERFGWYYECHGLAGGFIINGRRTKFNL